MPQIKSSKNDLIKKRPRQFHGPLGLQLLSLGTTITHSVGEYYYYSDQYNLFYNMRGSRIVD